MAKKFTWRVIEDKKYGGYAIQRRVGFLWKKWWQSEYLLPNMAEAERFILFLIEKADWKQLNNKPLNGK